MATSQAASSGTAAAVGGTPNAVRETVVGSHVMEIDGSSATKDLGVGKSIKSTTFHVGGHGWYIECYPCGADEDSAGCVSISLCLAAHKEQVEAKCDFVNLLVDDDGDLHSYYRRGPCKHTYNAETSWRGDIYDIDREDLESVLNNDCFKIRCDVSIVREFPALPTPELHRPLSDLLASGMPGDLATIQVGGELFTIHRGLRGSSTHVAASATSAAGAGTAPTMSAENVAGSHVLTIHGYSNSKKAFHPVESLNSEVFHVGGHRWYLELFPSGEKVSNTNCLPIFLVKLFGLPAAVKVRFELTLLSLDREVISSMQSCYAFTSGNRSCRCYFPFNMEPALSPLQDSFHVKCDVTIVNEITPIRPPDLHRHMGDLLASQVGTDVTFDVSGELFTAHKCMLATRSTAFMAEFFGSAGKGGSTATVTRVQIDDIEPRVFKALLNFIYTDALPEVREEDKVVMAQGLLVAADRYAMERLKLICSDILCSYINDARTAITTLDLADKHGCFKLREACKKFLMDHFAKVAP